MGEEHVAMNMKDKDDHMGREPVQEIKAHMKSKEPGKDIKECGKSNPNYFLETPGHLSYPEIMGEEHVARLSKDKTADMGGVPVQEMENMPEKLLIERQVATKNKQVVQETVEVSKTMNLVGKFEKKMLEEKEKNVVPRTKLIAKSTWRK